MWLWKGQCWVVSHEVKVGVEIPRGGGERPCAYHSLTPPDWICSKMEGMTGLTPTETTYSLFGMGGGMGYLLIAHLKRCDLHEQERPTATIRTIDVMVMGTSAIWSNLCTPICNLFFQQLCWTRSQRWCPCREPNVENSSAERARSHESPAPPPCLHSFFCFVLSFLH